MGDRTTAWTRWLTLSLVLGAVASLGILALVRPSGFAVLAPVVCGVSLGIHAALAWRGRLATVPGPRVGAAFVIASVAAVASIAGAAVAWSVGLGDLTAALLTTAVAASAVALAAAYLLRIFDWRSEARP